MNHRNACILIFLLFTCSIFGFASSHNLKDKKQKTILLLGNVFDAFIKNLPIEAKVTLMSEDSSVIDTTTCRLEEIYFRYYFRVPAVKKKYIVKCSCQGYEDN